MRNRTEQSGGPDPDPFASFPALGTRALFSWDHGTEPLGDYAAGPNHTLPTGGTARFFLPPGGHDFVNALGLLMFLQGRLHETGKDV